MPRETRGTRGGVLSGWTPKTDLLLFCNTSSPPSASSAGFGGYDILDRAFGPSFPPGLLDELRRGGWMGSPGDGGGRGRLQPAKTKMDVDVNDVLQSLAGSFLGGYDGDGAKPGGANNAGGSTRGDESAFISRQERTKESFAKDYPLLHRLVGSIESTACSRLGKKSASTEVNGRTSKPSDAAYFEFDTSLTSVQIARYPGDGAAGYPRHCDRGAQCVSEPAGNANAATQGKAERLLTFVYYLTPDDWDAEDGGALRIFSPASYRGSNSNGESGHFDVTPYSDRLVVFRSDLIEHQVLPSLRRDRIAITVWLYGRAVVERSNPERERLPGPDTTMHQNNGAGKRSNSSLPPPLPLPAEDASIPGARTIFVAIPSYRDEETWPTIQSLVETARCPERVHVGVVFQVDTAWREEVRRFTTAEGSGVSIDSTRWSEATNLRTIVLDRRHATGPCYARHLAQTLHRGETYVLQIDSHMRFRPNWDKYLILQLDKTERPEKSVLTAYPPGYEPPNGPGPDAETRATVLVPWKFGDDGVLRQKGRLIDPAYQTGARNDNIPCLLYAGGFNFFHASLLDVCPYDAKLHGLFFGEEISLAVRLYTHGYGLFAPPETVCYHLWNRNPLRVREDDTGKRNQRGDALEVVRMQLRGIGKGLGTERTVEQFRRALGVDFEKKTLAPGCENGGLGKDAFVSTPSLSANTGGGGGAEDCNKLLSGEDMNSVLKLVGQYMATQ